MKAFLEPLLHKTAQPPYAVATSDTSSGNGLAHVYLIDASGRKIAAVWGPWQEKFETAYLLAASPELYQALVMVRDADDDCRRDGLPTIPHIARLKIDRAIAAAEGQPVKSPETEDA